MTVKELMEDLQKYAPDADIVVMTVGETYGIQKIEYDYAEDITLPDGEFIGGYAVVSIHIDED